MYCLFDASVIVPYYYPKAHKSPKVAKNARILIESVRSGKTTHFFYIPNFCIAEVFSTFMKYAYSDWNRQRNSGKMDQRIHSSLRKQFEGDIHNAKLFYHYELSRYHVLAINLVAPIDHYYKMTRTPGQTPASTYDQLIIAMGIHLVKIHGAGNVVVVTADDRLTKVIEKCRAPIRDFAYERLQLDEGSKFTGIQFGPESFPLVLNLKTATKTQLSNVFEVWPLPIKKRYRRPYLVES
jgi:hypothetical protein